MTVFTVYLVDMLINSIVQAPGDVVIDQHGNYGNADTWRRGDTLLRIGCFNNVCGRNVSIKDDDDED